MQALEEGTHIIHIPNNIFLDVFSSKLWKSIIIRKINNYILEYKVKNKCKNKLFYINSYKNNFKKYFLPIINK